MELPIAPGVLVAGLLADGHDGLGERLVRTLLALWDTPGGFTPFLALVRGAVDNEAAATMLREFLTREVLGRIAAVAAPDRPEFRASVAGSQIVGLAMARYIVRVAALAGADPDEIVAAVGPVIQRYLTGPLGSD
jgi:hypothetical protein